MRNYAKQSKVKKFWQMCKEKHAFCINKYSQKYFPCVSKTFPVLQQNSLCFPCLEKVRTKFPVFPVPWPPCNCSIWHVSLLLIQRVPYIWVMSLFGAIWMELWNATISTKYLNTISRVELSFITLKNHECGYDWYHLTLSIASIILDMKLTNMTV